MQPKQVELTIMKISKNKFVSVAYDLYVGNDDERELMESATKERPLQFIYGTGMMLPAFEENIDQLEKDSPFSFTLTPEQAYGDFAEERVISLPKTIFMIDGKFDDKRIKEGVTLPMQNADGDRMNGSVLQIKNDVVVMDFNHPLAGETLHFTGIVLDVHEPTADDFRAMSSGCGGSCEGCGESCGSN